MSKESILFPGLSIELKKVGQTISPFGFDIAYYGMVIALGMLVACLFISYNSKRYGENKETFFDMTIFGIIAGVVGCRIYYVAFAWDLYKDDLISIFNLRRGGLAIFGGIIAGVIFVFIFTRFKKIPYLKAGDIVIPGVLIGQIFGRFGNFFNREAFGGYSNGVFRMLIPKDAVRSSSDITPEMLDNLINIDGIDFISVHPTFLYEALWNTGIFIIIFIVTKVLEMKGTLKKQYGIASGIYFVGYGIGRFFIESLRTDQLLIPNTKVPVSMVVAVASMLFGIGIWVFGRRKSISSKK